MAITLGKALPEALLALLVAHALLATSPPSTAARSHDHGPALWSRTWLASGAAPLSYLLLAGQAHHRRVLPWAPLTVLLLLINLAEAASATSWLFLTVYTVVCWPLVFFVCLFQFDSVAEVTRQLLRKTLHFVHFAADSIALFELPALEIDTEVAGLMVIRGVTLSLSSLTLVAHGVEVGIKLSDDMELALQTDRVTVQLFRRIQIGDVYGNVKGGAYEQTFAELEGDTRNERGQVLMDKERPLIKAAVAAARTADEEVRKQRREEEEERQQKENAEQLSEEHSIEEAITTSDESASSCTLDGNEETVAGSSAASAPPMLPPRKTPSMLSVETTSTARTAPEQHSPDWSVDDAQHWQMPEKTTMAERMTNGHAPQSDDNDAQEVLQQTTSIVGGDNEAQHLLAQRVEEIQRTSYVVQAERRARKIVADQHAKNMPTEVNLDNERHLRAAICSQLHRKPSIQHPPLRSIRVTTLQNLCPPWLLRLFHRMPLLLRLLLNPIAYFHPIAIDSITVGASGRWMQSLLGAELFKHYAERSGEVRALRDRAFAWLSDANFVVGLGDFTGSGMVPVNSDHDIETRMRVEELTLYRTAPQEATLKKAIQLGGADASVMVPSMLLPHHDHLLPTHDQRAQLAQETRHAIRRHDSAPKIVQAERTLKQSVRDETNCQISAHIHLPAVFDQELLNFISALVKASKIIEFEHTLQESHHSKIRSVQDLGQFLKTELKENMKKATVNAAANDRWIAKMVGRITSKLEGAHGDVGYSGTIPVLLKPYRDAGTPGESKLLP